ncbi:protein unc-45 homolog B [Pundamilia nyererei]|uniref:Protein unc-45 homolog B n=1 Tax=Pundamilia nyererei TaxID=303518 RepID=A0A9Y3QVI8_9CICH|nr:PREDICTED: protein unc-45 homolog B-like [Pundamilia nyererei]
MGDPIQLKEEGNKHFQAGDIDKAIECYTKAIKVCQDKKVLAVIYRNRSACYLKKENYVNAASDATKAIDVDAKDIKALYRRCQALEKLGKLDMAFKDVQRCATLEPKNKAFLETLRRLGAEIQSKLKTTFSTDSRVQNMFDILFHAHVTGCMICFPFSLQNPLHLLQQAMAIIQMVGVDKMCSIMAVDNEEIALAACNLFQCINDSLTGGDTREYGKEADLVMDPSKDLKTILLSLLEMVASKKVSGHGRDQALNLLSKNVPRKEKKEMDHSKSLFTIDHGLKKILKVCGQVPELPDQLPLTENTQLIASVLLNKLYDDLKCDPERNNFRDICDEYIKSKIDPKDMDKTIHAINCISGLLQGPFDVGNALVGRQGIMEMMVALCGSEREVDQMVAVEALIHASSKMSRASFIITNGVSLLKDIYKKTKNEKIKIRALVGLCKLGSAGGDDYSLRQFAEGSTEKLAKQCRKWLCNPQIDTKTRKWAIEGLAYLTNDADVKDDFVDDEPAMQAMFELAKSRDKTILYAVACILVNCTNSYEKKEILPELVQLAKFSKQHVPEQHPKVREECKNGNDKLKLLVLLCGEDDDKLQIAAAGALAMITAAQKKLCTKMTLVTSQWLEILQRLCLHSNVQVQHRGLVIVYNMLNSDNSDLAKKLIESELLEILSVVGRAEDNPKRQEAIDAARTCLVKAMDLGLIKPFASPS